jgi:hypothetical protein
MKDSTRKENQNTNQTPQPEYHSNGDDFISELVRKVAEEMRATNTPILSYESSDSPVWISDYLKQFKWNES